MRKLKVMLLLVVLVMCLTACKMLDKEKIETYKDEKTGVSFEYSYKFKKVDVTEDISLKINEEVDNKIDIDTSECNVIMQNDNGEIILLKILSRQESLNADEEIRNELEKQKQEYDEISKIAVNTKIIKNEIITLNEKLALDTQIESNGVRTRLILIKFADKSIELQYIARVDDYNDNNSKYLETIKL